MSAQVKLASRKPGIPARRAATRGDGRGVAEDGRRPLVAEPGDLVVDPRHRLGVDLGGEGEVAGPSVAWLSPGGLIGADVGERGARARRAAGAARASGRTGWGRSGS